MTQQTQQETEIAGYAEPDCSHHWLIDSPAGPTSTGTCRVCGEIREFKNSIQITSWESEGNHLNRAQHTT